MNLNKIARRFFGAAACALMMCGAALAQDKGTAAEAETMVKKVVASIKANGAEKTYEEINAGKSFKDRDLYIVIFDMNGKNLAHGTNPKLIGKEMIAIKDPDGKPFVKMIVDLGKEKGKGVTESFRFMNFATQKIESKVMHVERVGDTVVACGVYQI